MTTPPARGRPIGRRGFLRQATGQHRLVTLRCGRLYVRYVDARARGRVADLVAALQSEVGHAHEVRLVEREWLADEGFSRMLARVLPPRLAVRV